MPQPEAQPPNNSNGPAGKPEAFRHVLRRSRTNTPVIKDCLVLRSFNVVERDMVGQVN